MPTKPVPPSGTVLPLRGKPVPFLPSYSMRLSASGVVGQEAGPEQPREVARSKKPELRGPLEVVDSGGLDALFGLRLHIWKMGRIICSG